MLNHALLEPGAAVLEPLPQLVALAGLRLLHRGSDCRQGFRRVEVEKGGAVRRGIVAAEHVGPVAAHGPQVLSELRLRREEVRFELVSGLPERDVQFSREPDVRGVHCFQALSQLLGVVLAGGVNQGEMAGVEPASVRPGPEQHLLNRRVVGRQCSGQFVPGRLATRRAGRATRIASLPERRMTEDRGQQAGYDAKPSGGAGHVTAWAASATAGRAGYP